MQRLWQERLGVLRELKEDEEMPPGLKGREREKRLRRSGKTYSYSNS